MIRPAACWAVWICETRPRRSPAFFSGLGGPLQAPAFQLGNGHHLAAFAEDDLDGPVRLDPRLGRRVLGHDPAPLDTAVEAIALDGQGGFTPGRLVAGLGQGFPDELGTVTSSPRRRRREVPTAAAKKRTR